MPGVTFVMLALRRGSKRLIRKMRFLSLLLALSVYLVLHSNPVIADQRFHFAEVTDAGESFWEHPIFRDRPTETALYAEADEPAVLQLEYFQDQRLVASAEFQLVADTIVRLPAADEYFEFVEDGVHTLKITEDGVEVFSSTVVVRKDLPQPAQPDASSALSNENIEAVASYSVDLQTSRDVSVNRTLFATLRSTGSQVYDRVAPSVTLISTPNSMGSGVAIDEYGLTLTNYHVVDGYDVVTVRYKPETIFEDVSVESYVADVVFADPTVDLALIQLRYAPNNLRPIALGRREDIRIGADVHAIGHPRGGNFWSYTRGYISQFMLQYEWATEVTDRHSADVIQTQTPINPGNSGGPLLSNDGRLLGINTFGDPDPGSQGLNFAVSLTSVEDFLGRFSAERALLSEAQAALNPTRMFDENGDGRVDYKLYDDDGNGVYERADVDWDYDGWFDAILYDDNQNAIWDLMVELVKGPPQFAVYSFDYDEDEVADEIGYDYDMDGAIDAFE